MPSLRLSVGVAACSDPAGLQQILESVLAQERAFDQVLVSHDQNDSAVIEILKRFGRKLEVIVVAEGLTPVQHWNQLAPHLTGDWISLLTSDDCARPNFAREVENTVSSSPSAVILRAGWMSIRD